jgi:fatty-acid desaturase
MWGEGWHNNHHHDPKNMRFGQKWYELDVTYWVLRLFRFKSNQH